MKEKYGKGDTILIRQVGSLYIGTVVDEDAIRWRLSPAVWVRHMGNNYSEALKSGNVEQVEPIPEECCPLEVTKSPVQDVCRWPHAVPKGK